MLSGGDYCDLGLGQRRNCDSTSNSGIKDMMEWIPKGLPNVHAPVVPVCGKRETEEWSELNCPVLGLIGLVNGFKCAINIKYETYAR